MAYDEKNFIEVSISSTLLSVGSVLFCVLFGKYLKDTSEEVKIDCH